MSITTQKPHRLTLRYSPIFHDYFERLSFATGLEISTIVRLCCQVAPYTGQFQAAIKEAQRRDRQVDRRPPWDIDGVLWLGGDAK